MVLIKNGEQLSDPWSRLAEDAAIPAEGPLVVTLAQWRERRDELLARGGELGIRLTSSESPAGIADDLAHFALCALEFPAFTDGRAYSYARLLRERYGFEGEVRAVGDVLLEQLHFMQRSGFDAFELDSESAIEDWKIAQSDIDHCYQPTADGRRSLMQLRQTRSE